MHVGASWYKALSETQFLNEKNIKTIPWPGNILGMNPIENLWASVGAKKLEKCNIINKNSLIERFIQFLHYDNEIQIAKNSYKVCQSNVSNF